MRAARKRVGSKYVSEGISYAQILKTKSLSSRRVATTPTTPSPVMTITSSTLNSSTAVASPSMVSTVNTSSVTNVSSTTALKPQFTAKKQGNSSGVKPKIRLPSSQPLTLKTSKVESSSSKSKKPSRFLIHSEEVFNLKIILIPKKVKTKKKKDPRYLGKEI